MRHRMWEKNWENWKTFISTIHSRTFILVLYLCVEFNKHSKCLRSGIRIVDKETHGGVNWCPTQFWTQQLVVWRPWGRAPGCEMTSPLIYRHTPTGDRNQRDSGKPETSLALFSNSEKNLGEAEEERGRASSRHNSRCSAGDAKESKGWEDVNAGCKACGPIDFYESLLKMPAEAEWMQRKRQHVEIFLQASRLCYVIWLHCDDSEAPRGHTLWHHSFQRCGPGYLFMLGCSTISLAARGRSIQMMCWFFPAVLLKFHMRSDAALNPFAVAFASAAAGQFNGAITPRSSATNMKIGHSSSTQPSAAFSFWS